MLLYVKHVHTIRRPAKHGTRIIDTAILHAGACNVTVFTQYTALSEKVRIIHSRIRVYPPQSVNKKKNKKKCVTVVLQKSRCHMGILL